MYCEKCGKEISNYSLRCRYCSSEITPDYEFLTAQGRLNDKAALEALYKSTYSSAYFVAYRMTKNRDNAVDILHDCYIKAFANLDTIAEPRKFDKWFNKIVANKCLDYLKRQKPMFLEDVYGEEFEEDLPDDRYSNNPQIFSENEDINRIVRQIIDELPEEQRLCVLMYYFDEMSVRDIAEELGVSENTVKSRLRLARNRIKAEIERLENKGYEFRCIVIGPIIMSCLKNMETDMPVQPSGFEGVFNEFAGSAPNTVTASQAVKAAGKAAHSAVKAKIIIGLICGAAAVAGIAAAAKLLNNEDESTPTVADSSVSDNTTDTSVQSSDTTSSAASEVQTTVSSETDTAADSSETEPESEPEPEEGWRDAYKELVNNYENLSYDFGIDAGELSSVDYSLYDIDKDSVPELIFHAYESYGADTCKIYSYREDGAFCIGDLPLDMGTVGEFSDSGQFAVTCFYQYNGQCDYYSVDISGNKINSTLVETVYVRDSSGSHSYADVYVQLENIVLLGDTSVISDDPTAYIDSWGKEKEEQTEKPESPENLNKFIGMSKDELINDYFNGKYEAGQISRGQEYILSVKGSSVPCCEFGIDESADKVSVIQVIEGGELSDKIKIGMTYNELKEVCDFDMAYATFTTYDTSIDVTIDGEKWHIAFALTDEEKLSLGMGNLTVDTDAGVHQFDLSEINPKSTLGYYTEGR